MNELGIALEHANCSNVESQATIKKYQHQIKEAQLVLEQEQIARDRAREGLIQAERRSHAVGNELEESKTQLELADRQRRVAEQELSDVVEQLSDHTLQNQALQTAKRKLDSEIQTLRVSPASCLSPPSLNPFSTSGGSGRDAVRGRGGRGASQEVHDRRRSSCR